MKRTLARALSLGALKTDGDYFASFIDASPDCIRILDLEGRIEFINDLGLALLEIDDFETVRGIHVAELWPQKARGAVNEALKAALAGRSTTLRDFCPTAKGADKWWDTIVWPVFGVDSSQPIRIMARSRDITEEVETRRFLDAIVESVPAGIFAKDARTGRFTLVNHAAEDILGYAREEMIGKSDHDLFPKAQADLFRETDLRVIESGGLTVIEEEVTTAAGEVRWFRTKKIALQGEQGARHLLAVAEDITEARAADAALHQALDQAQAANRAKSDFLATMSHEIRTPLNGVLGMAQAMQAGKLDNVQKGQLRVIQRSGETLLTILNDILDLSKIEAGKLELELTDFDLEHLARGAVAAFAPLAENKGVALALAVDPEVAGGALFNGDATRIRRLFYNLLSNAVKFTDAGEIRVTVSYAGERLRIVVADSGIGIAPEHMQILFDKFVQGDASYTRRFGGSGLGLAICRGLAELMGGTINVVSTEGQGSTFTVDLALRRALETPPSVLPSPWPAQDNQPNVRVLAAEDNEVNGLVLKTLLHQVGIDPLIVDNGLKAVEAWEGGHWDVVLMDIQMPEMDGLSATRAIRAREAETGRSRTPIIAVTANAMTHQVREYEAAGMDDVVSKPLDAGQLFLALERALEPDEADPTALAS